MQELGALALRVGIVYVFLLTLLRVARKRSIGEITPFDLMIALVISDLPDDMIYGESPFAAGAVAILTLMIAHMLLSYAAYRFPFVSRLVYSTPDELIERGKVIPQNGAFERIGKTEIAARLREFGVDDRAQVEKATLEPSGVLSVLRRKEFKPIEKRDLG